MRSKLTSLVLLALLSSVAASALAIDRVGNGGNFHELQFTALAYELQDALIKARLKETLAVPIDLAKLRGAINNATVKARDYSLTLQGEPKHAINYPDLVLVEFETAEWKTAGLIRRYEMVMHELYPLTGTLDTGYHKAIAQIRQLQKLGLLGVKAPSRKVTPVLLYTAYDSNAREGLSLGYAEQICARHKEVFGDEYFAVYCHYIEKSWNEYRHSETKVREYGVKIYGLGKVTQLPWQVLMTSTTFGEGLGARAFATRSLARDACRALVYKLDDGSGRFYRAVCRTSLDTETGKYHYEIVTQNPLANSAMHKEN